MDPNATITLTAKEVAQLVRTTVAVTLAEMNLRPGKTGAKEMISQAQAIKLLDGKRRLYEKCVIAGKITEHKKNPDSRFGRVLVSKIEVLDCVDLYIINKI